MALQPPRRLRLTVPALSARLDAAATASVLTRHVAAGTATTKAELTRTTGLARTSVSTAVDELVRSGVLQLQGTTAPAGRGRPGDVLGVAAGCGTVVVADVGASTTRLCVSDLDQRTRARAEVALDVRLGPEEGLRRLEGHLDRLLAAGDGPVLALVVGLPGPVDTRAGHTVRPPIMPGWDGFPVATALAQRYSCPVVVENDVNLRALGEARALPEDQCPLLFVKVGTGIGAGIVTADGHLHHGADGAAGDIGHVRTRGASEVVCACGARGCVEATASSHAVLADLATAPELAEHPPRTVDDVFDLVRRREPTALRRVHRAAVDLGEVVAMLVHFYNPARLVLGGTVTEISDDVLAGIRSVVYRSALPLATRNLVLTSSQLGPGAGIAGGLVLGVELALSPEALARRTTRPPAATRLPVRGPHRDHVGPAGHSDGRTTHPRAG